jgi:predicted ATPase
MALLRTSSSVCPRTVATRLFEAVGRLLERLAKAQPLLLVLEDVHWADEASIRLTSVLPRRIASWPILIVLTAREEDVAEAPVLRDLLRLSTISRLPLGPLSQEDTTALVQSLAPRGRAVDAESALAERMWGASNGNPFVVVETLRALEQGALPTTTADALACRNECASWSWSDSNGCPSGDKRW